MMEFMQCWEDADVNKDEVLDGVEFKTFRNLMAAKMKVRFGASFDLPDAEIADQYNVINKFTPGTEGISKADMGRFAAAAK